MRSVAYFLLTSIATVVVPLDAQAADNGNSAAVLIRYIGEEEVSVVMIRSTTDPALKSGKGILLWSEQNKDLWRQYPRPKRGGNSGTYKQLTDTSRATSDMPSVGVGAFTTQLDQLTGLALVRGSGFLTPPSDAKLLNPRIVVRRTANDKKPLFPASTFVIAQGKKEIVQFVMKEGQATLRWDEIKDLPKSLVNGLPEGDYFLREVKGVGPIPFSIEPDDVRQWVMEWPAELAKNVGTDQSPLYVQMVVEHLLGQLDETGEKPLPYFADALDLIESLPQEKQTAALQRTRETILARLAFPVTGKKSHAPAAADPTGIKEIDHARLLIASGKWNEAKKALASPVLKKSPRAQGLAALYRAVILAESGLGGTESAMVEYTSAFGFLRKGSVEDRFRFHNNLGTFFLNQAQDRLYNHAFKVATGSSNVLLKATKYWHAAREQQDQALTLAAELKGDHVAASYVNQARAHAIMADLIRTLDRPTKGQRAFSEGEQIASAAARKAALAALAIEKADEITKASALEVLAQLAFRNADYRTSAQHATRAEKHYLEAGSLAGVESVRRLSGLTKMRGQDDAASRRGALRDLLISHEIAEQLRDQIPNDQVGVTRAGFLARRSYVNELLITLLVEQGEDARALTFAELAKARSMQDILTGQSQTDLGDDERRNLDEMLSDWPADTAALEYFLGTKQGWVFVIDKSGEVKAHAITNDRGDNIPTRTIVGAIKMLQKNMGSQAPKMLKRLHAGQGFDHNWQDDLHLFNKILIPDGVLAKLKEAKTVIVVPHHILHYFPFAALVTERDESPQPQGLAKPRFLLDEGFDLAYAPSLLTWDFLRQNSRPISNVNAMGIVDFASAPRLPGVETDLQNLRAAFGSRVKVVLPGDEATEENAKKVLQKPGLLLFSTHGHNVADKPLSSFLLCHADQHNDGRLTAKEIFGLDVKADLIVMSACYSGLADRSPLASDDLFGLQRAFLNSGSQTVLSGLWDVYDGSGPVLMDGYFQRMAAGQTGTHSLAETQRAFLKKLRASRKAEPWLHPYFWAVYKLSGNDQIHFSKN